MAQEEFNKEHLDKKRVAFLPNFLKRMGRKSHGSRQTIASAFVSCNWLLMIFYDHLETALEFCLGLLLASYLF